MIGQRLAHAFFDRAQVLADDKRPRGAGFQ